MAINKVGSKGIEDGSVAAADLKPGNVTAAKLNATQNLSSKTITLPNTSVTSGMLAGSIANAKLANSSITVAGTAVALGASGTVNNQFVEWQSKITSDGSTVTTMVAGRGYFVDNSSAVGLVKLPASAAIGDTIMIKDYAVSFGTNKLTIQRNSHKIQGATEDSEISTARASVRLVYVDATQGWLYSEESNVSHLEAAIFTEATGGTVATSGDFKIHSFTGDGNFVVSQLGNVSNVPTGGPGNVDYLVVAGGGGGDNGNSNRAAAGGGGAGGYRTTFPSASCNAGAFPVTTQTYPITVGAGGAGGAAVAGSNSIFSTITSAGGGYGFGGDNLPAPAGGPGGGDGGSGGGGDYADNGTAGNGNKPPVSPPQGNNGGIGDCGPTPADPSSTYPAGGGGGASAVGGNGHPGGCIGGAGGAGAPNQITGSNVTYAGGGGGGVSRVADTHPAPDPKKTSGPGGAGGGGRGSSGGPEPTADLATAGSANTGGGGGGGAAGNVPSPVKFGGAGGKGIVIIRYKFQ